MWMVNPLFMCDQHLLGEHVEVHMFVGSMAKGIRMDGYVRNGLLDLSQIERRHQELAREMTQRGFKHKSEMDLEMLTEIYHAYSHFLVTHIDRNSSLHELIQRCSVCKSRYEDFKEC
jgi:hypothetical protein